MSATRPLRVMHVIARLNVGGAALHVAVMADRLREYGVESTLVCGRIGPGEGDMAYLAEERGIMPVYVPELGRELHPLRDLVTLIKLWRLMRRLKPDVVHTHTAKAGFVGRWAAWLARVPVRVHTYHGHVFHGYFGAAKTRLFLALERLTARLTDRLITISPALRDELSGVYRIAPLEKFAVVPLGLELAPYAAAPRRLGTLRAAHIIPPDAPLIGIVGRIVPIKNHALFLEMASRVLQSQPDAYFLIVGDGEDRAASETLSDRLGLRKRVVFTGWARDLVPVFSDLDLLVLSSDNEGTPTSIMQALAAGVPVVSTAVGGVPDLLHDGAWGRLAPSGDADKLAEAVLAALRDPAPDPAIREAVLAEYDAGRLAESLAQLYRALLAAKGREL